MKRGTPRSDSYTFGHDIEGSWLLCEAAEALNDRALLREVEATALAIADAVRREGMRRHWRPLLRRPSRHL